MTDALLPRHNEIVRPLAVTAAALVVFRAGSMIPIPGLDPHAISVLAGTGGDALSRISLFALGIMPLFGALVLVQLARLLVPAFAGWERADPGNQSWTSGVAVALALIMATVQASAIASALESISALVAEPGLAFRLTCTALLVAGAAVVIWLADQITRRGVGSGVWLLLVAPLLAELPARGAALADLFSRHEIAGTSLLIYGAFAVLALVAVTALFLAGGSSRRIALMTLWPVLLAYAVLPWLTSALGFVVGSDAIVPLLEYGHPVRLVLLAALLVLFTILQARAEPVGGTAAETVPAAVAALVLVAVTLASELLSSHLKLPFSADARSLVVIAVVAMSVLASWAGRMR